MCKSGSKGSHQERRFTDREDARRRNGEAKAQRRRDRAHRRDAAALTPPKDGTLAFPDCSYTQAQQKRNVAVGSVLSSTHLMNARLVLCTTPKGMASECLGAPVYVFSVLKFKADEGSWLPGEPDEVMHSVETQRRLQHGSYAELLRRKEDDTSSDDDDDRHPRHCRVYNPYFLDDPEMRISKDRTVIKQEGYVVSCIPYVKPLTMKEELNGLFLAKHGDWLEDREVTLSKVRALKTQMVEIVKTLDLDLSTAAMAHVYVEKLILKNLVRKHSRKVTAGVCLMLAVKFNEVPDEALPVAPYPLSLPVLLCSYLYYEARKK